MPLPPGNSVPDPRLRNFILDVLAEGRRKNIAHNMLEADIGPMRERLVEHRRAGLGPVSITSYVAKSFACAIDDDKRMQAYRLGKSRLVVFDDVDLTFMVEREWEGEPLLVSSIVRAAQRKTTHEIHRELQAAKETLLGTDGPMNALRCSSSCFRLSAQGAMVLRAAKPLLVQGPGRHGRRHPRWAISRRE
jgi:hypothetical protein